MTQTSNSTEGKTLAELQSELDMGVKVYPSTNHDVIVERLQDKLWNLDRYVFSRYEDGTQREKPSRVPPTPDEYTGHLVNHVIVFFADENRDGGLMFDETDTYETFQELLEDWPSLSAQPVWGTGKTLERKRYEREHDEEYKRRFEEDEKIQKNMWRRNKNMSLSDYHKRFYTGKTLKDLWDTVLQEQSVFPTFNSDMIVMPTSDGITFFWGKGRSSGVSVPSGSPFDVLVNQLSPELVDEVLEPAWKIFDEAESQIMYEGKPVIVGKTLAEVVHMVDAGEILYAHTGKPGDIQLYRAKWTGRYIYELDYCRLGSTWTSDPGEDLDTFLQNILSDATASDEIGLEMKDMLSRPVWSNIDEQHYHMLLEKPEEQEKPDCDKCPGMDSFTDQSALCKDCADAMTRRCWDLSTAKRELDGQRSEDLATIGGLIVRFVSTYAHTSPYPAWQYAASMCKELAEIDWQRALDKDSWIRELSEHPF